MGNLWAHSLPNYLQKWGVPFSLEPGWETRSRSSGGLDAVWGIGVHHTASQTSVENDTRYMWYNSDIRPVGNCLLARDGSVRIGAAGATNTQGSGGPYHTTRGTIPLDAGNRYTYSIEAANNGVGEPWTADQERVYPLLCVAVMDWATNDTPGAPLNCGDIFSHFEWAPGRKIDPAGPAQWSGYTNASWNMDSFRGSVFAVFTGSTPPPVNPPDPNPIPPPVGDTYLTNMPNLQQGASGNAVVTLQTLLIQRGLWTDKPANRDGVFGSGTDKGVRDFQASRHITVDGKVGSETWNELGH